MAYFSWVSFYTGMVCGALFLFEASASARELLTGDYIAQRIFERAEGTAVTRSLSMLLTDKRGKTRQRDATVYRRHLNGQKQTAIRFEAPRSVKGMAFLTHDHSATDKTDEQWLYLPSIKKVRRIPASGRGDYFLGTDFTYNDVKEELKFEPGDYHFQYVESLTKGIEKLHRIKGQPSSDAIRQELGYGGFTALISDRSWMPVHIEFLDTDGVALKTVRVGDIQNLFGVWTALSIEVVNAQTGHQTVFRYSDIEYSEALEDKYFSVRRLKSASNR